MLNQLKDVFASFQKHKVKYLVIGGIAAIVHGVPRTTFDVDILILATQENSQALLDALDEAKIGTSSLVSSQELLSHEITVFDDRVRIDVQTRTPGIEFSEAWERKVTVKYRDQQYYVVSKEDLIASKEAAGRPVDLEDVRLLRLADEGKNT